MTIIEDEGGDRGCLNRQKGSITPSAERKSADERVAHVKRNRHEIEEDWNNWKPFTGLVVEDLEDLRNFHQNGTGDDAETEALAEKSFEAAA